MLICIDEIKKRVATSIKKHDIRSYKNIARQAYQKKKVESW